MWPYIIFPVLHNRKPYFFRIGRPDVQENVLYTDLVISKMNWKQQNNWSTIILSNFFSLKLLNIEQVNLIVDYN
jgi:hypothetical protein